MGHLWKCVPKLLFKNVFQNNIQECYPSDVRNSSISEPTLTELGMFGLVRFDSKIELNILI